MPFLTEEVYNVKPEERDTIGTNPSTRLFIVVVQGGAGRYCIGYAGKKTKEDTLNLSNFDGDSALKGLPAGLIGGFTKRTSVLPSSSHLYRKQVISEHGLQLYPS